MQDCNYISSDSVNVSITPPYWSDLIEADCIHLTDVIADLYNIVGKIRDEIDVSALSSSCMTYGSNPTVSSVLTIHGSKLCSL